MSNTNDIFWLHAVRVFAITCVVLLHVAAQTFFLGEPFGTYEWVAAEIFNALARVCVPLFFMVSGYLLINKQETALTFYSKRAKRIVLPLIFWSFIYLALIYFVESKHPSNTSMMSADYMKRVIDSGWMVLVFMLIFPVYYHLWFLYALIIQYLLMPLWQRLHNSVSTKTLWYLMLVWSLLSTVIPIYHTHLPSSFVFALALLFSFTGYLFLGRLCGQLPLTKRLLWASIIIAAISNLFTIIGTYYLSEKSGGIDLFLQGGTLNMIINTVAAFYIIRYFVEKSEKILRPKTKQLIKLLSETSFGVYLIHPIFLYVFAVGTFGFTFTSLSFEPLISIPLLTLLTMICSDITIRLLQRSSWLKPFVG